MIFYIVSAVALLIAALIVIDGFKTWGKKSGFMRIGVTAVVLFLGLWFQVSLVSLVSLVSPVSLVSLVSLI